MLINYYEVMFEYINYFVLRIRTNKQTCPKISGTSLRILRRLTDWFSTFVLPLTSVKAKILTSPLLYKIC
jgi:hypothetical protein